MALNAGRTMTETTYKDLNKKAAIMLQSLIQKAAIA
jgi:hypothetical protein